MYLLSSYRSGSFENQNQNILVLVIALESDLKVNSLHTLINEKHCLLYELLGIFLN